MAEILVGRYFGGLLKICHLAESTLAVELVLAKMIFIAKWLIECAGTLTRPWASFHAVRTKSMIKCNWKLNLDCFHPVGLYSNHVHVVWIALIAKPTLLLPCTKLFREVMPSYAAFNGKFHADMSRLACLAAGLVHRLWLCNNDDITNFLLSKPPIRQNKLPAKILQPYGNTI